MMYKGESIKVDWCAREVGVLRLCFDKTGAAVNLLDQGTLREFQDALQCIEQTEARGLLLVSAKEHFILGADIGEFLPKFRSGEEEIRKWLLDAHQCFNAFEDLDIPKVCLIDGFALGGGFELSLLCDYRIVSPQAKIGLPEIKLGLFPGFGGTVRLSRLIGLDNALEWICQGQTHNASTALKVGAVDAIVEAQDLIGSGLRLIQDCLSNAIDFRAKKQEKYAPLALSSMEFLMAFEVAKGVIKAKTGAHYPAPLAVLKVLQKQATKTRETALEIEAQGFAKIAKTQVVDSLVGLYFAGQESKKSVRSAQKSAADIDRIAVVGSGIMGTGIAYQAALNKSLVVLKDLEQERLTKGLGEVADLLCQQVKRGKISMQKMGAILNRVQPTLHYEGFDQVHLAIEAVSENRVLKPRVLAEMEKSLSASSILATNTSTLSVDYLASHLCRPQNFCGMHFFNPVHKMPLVEVIRGKYTNDKTLASVVAFAHKLGKKPIVVGDCPGFFVNRVLFAYLNAFVLLLKEGADFAQIDKTLERFGWPMGPAYLLDVVGLDTAHEAQKIMAEGFEHLRQTFVSPITLLTQNQRFGQKNRAGFYQYLLGKKSKLERHHSPAAYEVLKSVFTSDKAFEEEEIIDRMMFALCLETVRCLEDGTVGSAADAEIGLVYGIGFPPFLGGALHYIDVLGPDFIKKLATYKSLGALYALPQSLLEQATKEQHFFRH